MGGCSILFEPEPENKLSESRHIQAPPLQEQKETILASAALPYT